MTTSRSPRPLPPPTSLPFRHVVWRLRLNTQQEGGRVRPRSTTPRTERRGAGCGRRSSASGGSRSQSRPASTLRGDERLMASPRPFPRGVQGYRLTSSTQGIAATAHACDTHRRSQSSQDPGSSNMHRNPALPPNFGVEVSKMQGIT